MKYFTDVFSRSSGIVPDSLQDKLRVTNDLKTQLQEDGGQEAVDPVVDIVRAPEKVEDKTKDDQTKAVGVKHVLGGFGSVPFLDKQRPPGSFVPSHLLSVVGLRVSGKNKVCKIEQFRYYFHVPVPAMTVGGEKYQSTTKCTNIVLQHHSRSFACHDRLPAASCCPAAILPLLCLQ